MVEPTKKKKVLPKKPKEQTFCKGCVIPAPKKHTGGQSGGNGCGCGGLAQVAPK